MAYRAWTHSDVWCVCVWCVYGVCQVSRELARRGQELREAVKEFYPELQHRKSQLDLVDFSTEQIHAALRAKYPLDFNKQANLLQAHQHALVTTPRSSAVD